MMNKKSVLFVCIHNSARSQMAEAYLNLLGQKSFTAQSAGIEPGQLNPIVVEVMKEDGIDISTHSTKSVQSFIDSGIQFDFIITVCDEASAERCPVFPGKGQRIHIGFEDPSSIQADMQEKLVRTRNIRDQIKQKIHDFILKYQSAC